MPPNIARIHYGWTLLPATLFLGVSILFDTLDNSIRVLQPFYELRHGPSDRERGKYIKDYSGLVPLQNLWYAIRHRHLALMASTIATFCGILFPIVVSGLFRYVYVDLICRFHLVRRLFNFIWSTSADCESRKPRRSCNASFWSDSQNNWLV